MVTQRVASGVAFGVVDVSSLESQRSQGSLSTDPDDLCTVDPAACPDLQPDGDSYWQRGSHAGSPAPEQVPGPLELGKRDPRGRWGFKFVVPRSIECNDD